jgi:hypothetical protein
MSERIFADCFPRVSSRLERMLDTDVARATFAGIDAAEANVRSAKDLR